MILLNFSHPLTMGQMEQLAELLGERPAVRTVAAQFDHERPFGEQIAALADAAGLTAEEWQTEPLLVNLPGYVPAAGCLLAEIHGRAGHFPVLLRLSPLAGSTPTVYQVSEVINLQEVRDQARTRRMRSSQS